MKAVYTLKTPTATAVFDRCGRLVSFRSVFAPEQEFVAPGDAPAFVLQFLDDHAFSDHSSAEAESVTVVEGENDLLFRYTGVGDPAVTVETTARVEEDCIRLSLRMHNTSDRRISGVQYPMVVLRYTLDGTPGSEALVYPYNLMGSLLEAPRPEQLEPDSPHAWQFRPENGNTTYYPGTVFAQFLAYYNDRAGFYISCDDNAGHIKLIKPVHRGGLRLGYCHAADWQGERVLGYDIVLQSFSGDWCDAADIYRMWAAKQPWAVPLTARRDVPAWLLESPTHVVLRIQGRLDEGPIFPNTCFQPYEKAIPLLEKVAEELESPILPLIMAWENKGPWVYPDCFPPVGGDESLSRFCGAARERDWHIGSYCNGTRWVTAHYWSGYDGREHFEKEQGGQTLCKTHDGQYWKELWDRSWRESYAGCLGVERTRKMAEDFCRRLMADGLDYIQFLDQNVNCTTFPCYAEEHGHAPMPDSWMTQAMKRLTDTFKSLREESGREMVYAVEQPCNEVFLQDIQICDVRVYPPDQTDWKREYFPLYHYLYHEYILLQGAFGRGQEPYHLQTRTAYSLVLGNIVGGVINDRGEFINRDIPQPWGQWDPPLGNSAQVKTMLRNAAALRRGAGSPYLVYGRMQRPVKKSEIPTVRWQYGGADHCVPAVFHALWTAPDKSTALVLANWTDTDVTVTLEDSRLGGEITLTVPALDGLVFPLPARH